MFFLKYVNLVLKIRIAGAFITREVWRFLLSVTTTYTNVYSGLAFPKTYFGADYFLHNNDLEWLDSENNL